MSMRKHKRRKLWAWPIRHYQRWKTNRWGWSSPTESRQGCILSANWQRDDECPF